MINIQRQPEVTNVGEVVVTALGITGERVLQKQKHIVGVDPQPLGTLLHFRKRSLRNSLAVD